MIYKILKKELALSDYQNKSIDEQYQLLTDKNICVKGVVSAHDIFKYLRLTKKLKIVQNSALESAIDALDMMQLFGTFDLSDPIVFDDFNTVLDALIADNLITIDDKDYLSTMSDKMISRAEKIGIHDLKIGQIKDAKKWL